MQSRRRFISATIAAGLSPSFSSAGEPVTVFAAASLTGAMQEIAAAFARETGHTAVVSFAGTSTLARQIDRGAPADIVVAANRDWMDWLVARGHVDGRSVVDLLGNSLVLISHKPAAIETAIDETLDLPAMLDGGRLAMALVDAVPAGIYGRAALQHFGLWNRLQSRVAQTDNVRIALALVATGSAPFGIVYRSDALAESRVHIVGSFPAHSHPPIIYPAAAMAGSENPATDAFMTFIQSSTSVSVFRRHGFQPLTAP